MHNQRPDAKFNRFINTLEAYGVGLAYFFGSQKKLGPRLLDGEPVAGAPESDLDLGVEIPRDELSSVASAEQWAETYDRIAELVRGHRTTLVFANTRRLTERAARALGERIGEGSVAAHHGSLSRARRLEAEERLKRGELKAIVATASLELGIDVGTVDLSVQLGSPGAVATGVQRSPQDFNLLNLETFPEELNFSRPQLSR